MKCPFSKKIYKGGNLLVVPCGKCEICLDNRRRDYTVRLNKAYKDYISCYFVTLTFNDEQLPTDREGCIRKFQLYMKRLRKADKFKNKLKYFSVLERGDINKRFHWHQLLFVDSYICKEEVLKIITDYWQYGIVDVGYLKEGGISYLTKYLFKEDYKMLISRGLGFPEFTEKDIDKMVDGVHLNGFQYNTFNSSINKLRRTNRDLFHFYQDKKREKTMDYVQKIISGEIQEETPEESQKRYTKFMNDKNAKDGIYKIK